MDIASAVFLVVVIIFSAIVHEVMHGVAADKLGDPTARYAGRLTLNPIPHIDPVGSILLPLVLALSGSPIFFGWAKPVPYNPYNLKPGRFSEAIVAGAGPLSNAIIAIVTALFIRTNLFGEANGVFFIIVLVNVMMCIFNLVPIPPLDGSKVLEAFLPRSLQRGYARWRSTMERSPLLGMILLLAIVFLAGGLFSQWIYAIASALAGM
ncbi:MAG TPA: site-2 protease family protein [Candidatus Paceibacterota bacterium]|nr:site-2 protease family protein [Candidatus Paceibacterota bacterium]